MRPDRAGLMPGGLDLPHVLAYASIMKLDADHPYHRCLCLAGRRLARVLTQAFDHALEPSGLTITQFSLLSALAAAGEEGMSPSRLAAAMDMDLSTVSRTLKPLTAAGLVRLVPGRDRRARMAVPTADGMTRLQAALPRWQEAQRHAEAALGEGARQDLDRLLQRARAAG